MASPTAPNGAAVGSLVPCVREARTACRADGSPGARQLLEEHVDALICRKRVSQQAPDAAAGGRAEWDGWFHAARHDLSKPPASGGPDGRVCAARARIDEQLSGYAVCSVASVGDRVGVLHASRDHDWFTLFLRMAPTEFDALVRAHGLSDADAHRGHSAWFIELEAAAARVLLDNLAPVSKKPGQVHHPEALSVLCHAATDGWLSNGPDGDSTDLKTMATDDQPPRLTTRTDRLRLVVYPPYPPELEDCFCAMGRPETFDASNYDSDDSNGGDRRDAVTLAQRVVDQQTWGPTHGTMLAYEGVQIFQKGRAPAAVYGVDAALVKHVPRFNELLHPGKRNHRLLRFLRPNGKQCAYAQVDRWGAGMAVPSATAGAPKAAAPPAATAPRPSKPKAPAAARAKGACGKAPKAKAASKPAKAGAIKPAPGKAAKADGKGATRTIAKAPKPKLAPKPEPAAPAVEAVEEAAAAADAPAAPAVEAAPAPSVSAIDPSDVEGGSSDSDSDSDSEADQAAKARAKAAAAKAAAAKAAARSAAAKKAAATKAAKRAAEAKGKRGGGPGGARARKRKKASSDSDDDGCGDDESDDYVEPDTDESEEASASGSESGSESGDASGDASGSESESEGGAERPGRLPAPRAPVPPAPAVLAPAAAAAPAAPAAAALEAAHLKAMTAPVVERLARRIAGCARPWGRAAPCPAAEAAGDPWRERFEANRDRLGAATSATEAMAATLALLDGVLEREEAMATDPTLPLSASQVGDVRAMMQRAGNLGRQTLGGLEQAVAQARALGDANAQLTARLSTMLEGSVAAMETLPPAARALEAAALRRAED